MCPKKRKMTARETAISSLDSIEIEGDKSALNLACQKLWPLENELITSSNSSFDLFQTFFDGIKKPQEATAKKLIELIINPQFELLSVSINRNDSLKIPDLLRTIFTASAPERGKQSTKEYQWRQIILERLQNTKDRFQSFDLFSRKLMILFAQQGEYRALADFLPVMPANDRSEVIHRRGRGAIENSVLTKAAEQCANEEQKQITLFFTHFLAVKSYLDVSESKLNKNPMTQSILDCRAVSDHEDRQKHWDECLNVCNQAEWNGTGFDVYGRKAQNFQPAFYKRGFAKLTGGFWTPSQRYALAMAGWVNAGKACASEQCKKAYNAFQAFVDAIKEEERSSLRLR